MIASVARRLTSSCVNVGLPLAPGLDALDERAGVWLWRGWPTVSTASRWTCGSTSGGERNRPSASVTRSSPPACRTPIGRTAAMKPSSMRMSTRSPSAPPWGGLEPRGRSSSSWVPDPRLRFRSGDGDQALARLGRRWCCQERASRVGDDMAPAAARRRMGQRTGPPTPPGADGPAILARSSRHRRFG